MAFLDVTDMNILCSMVDFLRSEFDICSDDTESGEADTSYDMGPDADSFQLSQGLLLEIDNTTYAAKRLYTRYGQWTIIHGASSGFFKKVFDVVKERLNLEKINDFSKEGTSLWAILSWEGSQIEKSVIALPADRLSQGDVDKLYTDFLGTSKV